MKKISLHLWFIRFIGLIVPARLRPDWQQEWEAELRHREALLAQWDKLHWQGKFDLLRRSTSAFIDALWLLPKRWEDDMMQDIRYAVRMLRRAPGYTAVAVLALGLGIGVNTAILSSLNGFLLRPLAVEKPEGLVSLFWGRKTETDVWGLVSYANYVDLRAQNQSFADLCAYTEFNVGISAGDSRKAGDSERAEVAWGEIVSGNYFTVMGVQPMLGRTFSPEEDRASNTAPVAVISHSLWQRRFHSDAAIVGKTIYLNGHPFQVIGVMPESFLGSTFFLRTAFWVPLMMGQQFWQRADWQTARDYASFEIYGRLKPGVTMQQAETDLNLIAAGLAERFPRENADTKIQLTTEQDGRYNDATKIIKYGGVLALCIAALVLLVACANVANLMLARAATRSKEIGIRLAIGAGRGRVVRQLLTESLLLSLLGGAVGLLFAYWGAPLIAATKPPVPFPVVLDFAPDKDVLLWLLPISLLTGVIFGMAPALLASRTDLVAVIKSDAAASNKARGRWNLRGVLVVAQVAISIVVLVCAGLFMRSLRTAINADPGFRTDNLVTMTLDPRLLAYDEDARQRFYRELQRRVAAQPGVRAVSLASDLPLTNFTPTRGPIVKEGEADPPPNQGITSYCTFVAPNYFETVQTPLLLGRDFTDRDTADALPVVIVNQTFARKFYGSPENALDKRFRFVQGTPLMQIIGVAKDGRYRNLYGDLQTFMYLPAEQHPQSEMTLAISAQSAAALPSVVENARREIAQLDARMPVIAVMMAEENMALAWWWPRVAAGIATTFGVLALLLATMGLYSVMSYAVSQRTREIGIRMALGAQVLDVLRLVVSQGMRMVLLGLGLGLLGAFALTRVLASLLLGVGATDPLTFVGVAILLVAIALLACWLPARRATKVDPMIALRHD